MGIMQQIVQKISSRPELVSLVKEWREKGEIIVFTNGCFDLLHRGHIEYLAKASEQGDRFIIGLNSDRSIRNIKGSGRPVQDEQSRAMTLAALLFVDAVSLFDEDTPEELIDAVIPDRLIKGGDYRVRDIVGYDTVMSHGGKVLTIPLIEGYSTTRIIDHIKKH